MATGAPGRLWSQGRPLGALAAMETVAAETEATDGEDEELIPTSGAVAQRLRCADSAKWALHISRRGSRPSHTVTGRHRPRPRCMNRRSILLPVLKLAKA